GINAEGIRYLYKLLHLKHNVTIVAPLKEMSGCSHSITLRKRLNTRKFADDIYGINGTPTDCVVLAVNTLLEERPELIISGINSGPNLGFDVTYSGTVGAAIEGAIEGIPSIAISITGHRNFDDTPGVIFRLISSLNRGEFNNFFLNVNVPSDPKGIRVTTLGRRSYQNVITTRKTSFEIGGTPIHSLSNGDTDVEAIENHYISITPITLDIVDNNALKDITVLNEDFINKCTEISDI
ncbi:5'/3'-nucleotidase SurE, partial [candidate division WOR-3 bacterium]|nr:5'/3'-nucleotidase SurE [candidate division WOR-3 bacterium]